jgi:hypothetical protein
VSDWFGETEESKVAEALHATTEELERSPYESDRRSELLTDLELFLGVKLTSLYQMGGGIQYDRAFNDDQTIAFNLCYSITNTIRNRICSFRPRAQFLPDGGDFRAHRAARDMTDMSDAWAQREKYQNEASFAFRDTLTGDGGVLKLYVDNDNPEAKTADIKIGRFPSWEFMFDAGEGIHREPECGYHATYLPIEQASRRYKIPTDELKKYVVSMPQGIVYVQNREMVRIIDAYQRGPEGKHAVVIGPRAYVEDWEWDGIPFVLRVFDERPVGIWGDGAVKQLRAIQDELIEWQNAARESHHMSSQQVWQTPDDEEGPTKINNAVVRIERYKNRPSSVINPAAMSQEAYKYYETLKTAGYEKLGVSQFIAAGVKQPGINSAVAIRESSELQTDRLALCSQDWETTRVESAEWWRRLATKLVRSGYKLQYRAIRRGSFVQLSMDHAEREYEIRAFPSSLFGQTISGRLERATELIKAGFLTQEDALKALDVPDISPIIDLRLSKAYAMEYLVDRILEDGKYETPDEQLDPVAFYDYADKRYCLTISDGSNYPETNRAQLRKLLAYLKPKADAARAKQAAAQMAGVQPQAGAGASPEQIAAEQTPGLTPGAGAGGMAA